MSFVCCYTAKSRENALIVSIASKVSQPETSSDQILDTLRKAGLTELDGGKILEAPAKADAAETGSAETKTPTTNVESATKSEQQKIDSDTKKSVKFAEDVQIQEFTTPPAMVEMIKETLPRRPDPSLISGSFAPNERVLELDDDDQVIGATAVSPEDESPEDAQLRREMLQYGLNEIGSVVAELELDEDDSDDDEDDEDYDFGEESDISEEEDEHGRTTRKVVGSKYRQQMLELEEKLMARMIENVGPQPDEDNPEIDPEDLRRLVIRPDDEMPSTAKAKEESAPTEPKASSSKKGVRFSDVSDISESPTTTSKASKSATPKKKMAPIVDNIMERKAPGAEAPPQADTKPARVSRFKQAHPAVAPTPNQSLPSLLPQTTTTQPLSSSDSQAYDNANRPILSDSVIERPATVSTAPPTTADEMDPEIQQRQLASEYYRMRNNMVRQQGGFKMTEEDREAPLMEERDGKVKKVSRFKAARLQ